MPFHWVIIHSSPPLERRDEVAEICRRHGGRLCEGEIFYDEHRQAHALIETPADETAYTTLLDELHASQWVGLVHAVDQHAGVTPPRSGRR